MSAIGTAGQRLSTLNEGFYSYRDAVQVAAKASKVFGMDMATVGSMMGKMTTNFKMNLESIDDAFVQMSYDAEKSGLSTDRFLTAVQNASVGLSFYGTFIKTASKVMSEFTKTQVIGADEAESATQEIVQAFSKMDTKKAMSVLSLLPKKVNDEMKETFKNLREESAKKAKELGDQAIDVEAQLKVATPEEKVDLGKKLDQLRTEEKKQMEMSGRLQGAANGQIMSMAQNMGSLADKSPKAFLAMISAIGRQGDITKLDDNQLEVALEGVEKVTGLSQKTIKDLIAQTRANGMTLDIALGVDQASLDSTLKSAEISKKDDKGMLGYLKKMYVTAKKDLNDGKKYSKQARADADELLKPIQGLDENSEDEAKDDAAGKLAEMLGLQKSELSGIVSGVALNKDFKKGLENLIKEVASGKKPLKKW
jgi:hypothetical protein